MKHKTTLLIIIVMIVTVLPLRKTIAQNNFATAVAVIKVSVVKPNNIKGSEIVFGDIYPGTEQSIEPGDVGSAEFVIDGEEDKQVNLTFSLPKILKGKNGDDLAIDFETNDFGYGYEDDPSNAKFLNQNNFLETFLDEKGKLYFWLGGKITADINQTKDEYEGNIDILLEYTAN